MSPPNPHTLVAEHQLRAARAIVLDPTCDDRLAAGHLAAAWEALARAAGDTPALPDSFVPQAPPTPADGRTPPVPSDRPAAPASTHTLAPRPEDRAALTPSLAAAIDPVLPALLAERDAAPLLAVLADADARAVRARLTSFGSCSIDEPVAALRELGMIEDEDS